MNARLDKSYYLMHIEHGLYPSIVDIVVAMIDKVRIRICAQKYEYNGVYVSVDKTTQKNCHSFTRGSISVNNSEW